MERDGGGREETESRAQGVEAAESVKLARVTLLVSKSGQSTPQRMWPWTGSMAITRMKTDENRRRERKSQRRPLEPRDGEARSAKKLSDADSA